MRNAHNFNMGNLRGTRMQARFYRDYTPRKPVTIRNKLREIERKVNRQAPEKQYFNYSGTDATVAGVNLNDDNVSNLLVADPGFRDRVTGDKWNNVFLKIRFQSTNELLESCRVVVYSHKRGSSAYSFPSGYNGMTEIVDPSQASILADRLFLGPADTSFLGGSLYVKLSSTTLYNSETATFERGCVRVAVFSLLSGGVGNTIIDYQLCYYNK